MSLRPSLPLLCLLLAACPSAEPDPSTQPLPEPSPEPQATLDADFEADLLAVLDAQFDALDVPGLAIAIKPHDAGAWSAVRGIANPTTGEALERGHRFKIGSATETFAVAALLQSESDDFTIHRGGGAQELDGLSGHWTATVRQMLDHTSGLPDVVDHPDFVPSAAISQEELIALAESLPNQHGPGQARSYASTNYVYAGQLVEALSGRSWAEDVRARFLEPLDLDNAAVAGEAWGDVVRGTLAGEDVTDREHPSVRRGSGDVTMSVGNLALWGAELFGGDVLDGQQIYELGSQSFHQQGRGFVLGMELIDEASPKEQHAHLGLAEGYGIWLGYRRDLETAVAVLGNRGGTDWPPGVAEAIWAVVEQHVDPPTGDDDDTVQELPPAPAGQLTFEGLQTHDPSGAGARPEHTGVRIGGWWDFDNDGQTVGRFTLTSADYSSGQPVGAVQCSFEARGNYLQEWQQHGAAGALFLDDWGSPNCADWPSADSWRARIEGNVDGLHLVARDSIPPDWVPSWPGWQGDLDGESSVADYVQLWIDERQAAGQNVSVPWLVVGKIEGVTQAEPAIDPWTFLGFFWE